MGRACLITCGSISLTIVAIWAILAITSEDCPEFDLQPDFDPTKYTGVWYEYARDKTIPFERGDCIKVWYTDEDYESEGRITVINSMLAHPDVETYDAKEGSTFNHIKGYAECEGAKCEVNFFWYIPSGDYRVVSTDYENYSVVYSCSKYLGFYKMQGAWVLGRGLSLASEYLNKGVSLLKENAGYKEEDLYFT